MVDHNLDVKKESGMIFYNITKICNKNTKYKLVGLDILSIISVGLSDLDTSYLICLLRISNELLEAGQSESQINPVASLFEASGCYNMLIKLERHDNDVISSYATDLIQKYYGLFDEDFVETQKESPDKR